MYHIGISVLTLLFLFFDFGMFQYTKNRLAYYQKISYDYKVKIN
jgi:hypothetical protein